MFWKKVNRGLLLGGALLVFLVGFIIVKEVQFKKESPAIRARAEEYVAAFAQLQANVPGTLGAPVSDATRQGQLGKLDALLEEYWYGNLSKDEITLTDAGTMREDYISYLKAPLWVQFSSLDVRVLPDQVNVRKDGPNRALVSMTVEIKTEHKGDGAAFFHVPNYDKGVAVEEDDKESVETKIYSGVLACNFRLELQRVSGTWRVVGQEGYSYMTSIDVKGEW